MPLDTADEQLSISSHCLDKRQQATGFRDLGYEYAPMDLRQVVGCS